MGTGFFLKNIYSAPDSEDSMFTMLDVNGGFPPNFVRKLHSQPILA